MDSAASDTECASTAVKVKRLPPVAEAGKHVADFNLGDGANKAAAAQDDFE